MSRFLIYGLSNGIGGVEAIVLNMCKTLSAEHSFDFILSNGNCAYNDYFERYSSFKRINIVSWGRCRKEFNNELKQIFIANNYDYVWFNGCLTSNVDVFKKAKKYSRAVTIAHSHGASFEESNRLKRIILLGMHYINRRRFLKLTDIPCMCSKKSGEWFYGSKYLNRNDVFFIKNGIATDCFRFNESTRESYRLALGIDKNTYVLFHAGRLAKIKNQKFIIDIIANVKELGLDATLVIAGDGPLKEQLVNYTNTINIKDNVIFLGSRSDVAQLYQVADCFVLPSFNEGLPVTLIEAQTSGLPCYVSNSVTTEADVSGEVQFLDVYAQSPKDWAEVIVEKSKQVVNRSKGYFAVRSHRFSIEDVCDDFVNHISNYKQR